MKQSLKILVVRRDSLGDLMMTLPSLVFLRNAFPNAEIDLSCKEIFHDLLHGFCSAHRVGVVRSCSKAYDAALFLNGDFRDCWEVFAMRVRVRSGLLSKPWSFLLLNKGKRQSRSRVRKNEAEFNLDLAQNLARILGNLDPKMPENTELPIHQAAQNYAKKKLAELGIENSTRFVVVHPGMRGSALNVSTEGYLGLIESLEQNDFKVVLSIGPEKKDLEMKDLILSRRSGLPVISGLNLTELAELFRMAETVVAPSTGPLHLAHWVGTKTIGLYSPVKSQHPFRWAPWGGKRLCRVLVPSVDCPAQRKCLGETCKFFNCMDRTDWKSLLLNAENG